MARFFNALFDWELVNLNSKKANHPAADLGDGKQGIAIQVTTTESSDKITSTRETAMKHKLGSTFQRLIIFFLLARAPSLPKKFTQPLGPLRIECWDLATLLKQMQSMEVRCLQAAAEVLNKELARGGQRGPHRQDHRQRHGPGRWPVQRHLRRWLRRQRSRRAVPAPTSRFC